MTRKTEAEYRADMVEVCRRMHQRGYVAATDGNVSLRLGTDRLLFTPSGLSKGYLSADQLIVTDMAGHKQPPHTAANRQLQPSSEILLHLEVYRQRADVQAVVHAHPPVAVACTIAGVSLAQCVIPEVIVTFGAIPTAEYATPSSAEGSTAIRELIAQHDAILLDHHGTITVGHDVFDAYFKLEKVEHAAQVTLAAYQFGRVRGLPSAEVQKLFEMRERLGLGRDGGGPYCERCELCARLSRRRRPRPAKPTQDDELVQVVSREVLRALGK